MNTRPASIPFFLLLLLCCTGLLVCIDPAGPPVQPPQIALSGDSIVAVRDSVRLVASSLADGEAIEHYLWYKDCNQTLCDSSADSSCTLWYDSKDTGYHCVRVIAVSRKGLESRPDSLTFRVALFLPRGKLTADTAVWIADTLWLSASAEDSNGTLERYLWTCDTWSQPDTTTAESLAVRFSQDDAGLRTLGLRVVDDDGLVSKADSLRVRVHLGRPSVSCQGPDTVWINDTATFTATAGDSNGTVVSYLWEPGDSGVDTSDTALFRYAWQDAGMQTAVTRVIDDDGVVSAACSLDVMVREGKPRIEPFQDTLIGSEDTLRFTVSASDTNGTIEQFYIDLDGSGWDDSSSEGSFSVGFGGKSLTTVVVGARDDDGLVAREQFRIFFYLPATSVALVEPADTIAFHLYDSTFHEGGVSLQYRCEARHDLCSGMQYRIYVGSSPDTLKLTYSGTNTTHYVTGIDTGITHWTAAATNSFGASSLAQDSFVSVLEKTVCFTGHSIAVGMGDETDQGGFRGRLLDSLRTHKARHEKITPVGPLGSDFFGDSPDDRCLAVAGYTARMIYDSLYAYSDLNSDIWVLTIGVNGDYYTQTERLHTAQLINEMIRRNPRGTICVLNGLPLPDTTAQERIDRLYSYNQLVADIAAHRRSRGYDVRLVDAFHTLAPDSVFNPDYMVDHLHPNAAGYDLLAREIYRVLTEPQ